MNQHFAPGLRVELRDAEWRIKRVDHTNDGGHLLTCEGLSELVRGREGLFLTKLEQSVRILDPATTQLIDDLSSGYRASLRLDSTGLQRVRNRIPTNHNPFHYFDRSIISIDTLKQDIEYRHHLEQAYWDIIIIDERRQVQPAQHPSATAAVFGCCL